MSASQPRDGGLSAAEWARDRLARVVLEAKGRATLRLNESGQVALAWLVAVWLRVVALKPLVPGDEELPPVWLRFLPGDEALTLGFQLAHLRHASERLNTALAEVLTDHGVAPSEVIQDIHTLARTYLLDGKPLPDPLRRGLLAELAPPDRPDRVTFERWIEDESLRLQRLRALQAEGRDVLPEEMAVIESLIHNFRAELALQEAKERTGLPELGPGLVQREEPSAKPEGEWDWLRALTLEEEPTQGVEAQAAQGVDP